MTIISPLPFALTNGTTADATQVMADLNQIRTDVNNNAASGSPTITLTGGVTGSSTSPVATTVITNANLTGDVTSVGNATTIKTDVTLPGSPTTTTQSPADNSTKIATTAFSSMRSFTTTGFSTNGSNIVFPARSIPVFVIFKDTAGHNTTSPLAFTPSGGGTESLISAKANAYVPTLMLGYFNINDYFSGSPINIAVTCSAWNSSVVDITLYYVSF